MSIPVSALSNVLVYGSSIFFWGGGIAGSNLAGNIEVCLLELLCIVR
jgi:hypothetical protein